MAHHYPSLPSGSAIMKLLGLSSALLLAAASTDAFVPTNSPKVAFRSTSNLLASRDSEGSSLSDNLKNLAVMTAVAFSLLASPAPSFADGQTKDFRLPPIDRKDVNRCVFISSNMGQANAARDKLYDLRECNLSGIKAEGYDLSGVIMSKTDVSKVKFTESQFSKGYMHDSNFDGADFTNAIIDRASFSGSSLNGAIFTNAVLTGTSFEGADVTNSDFTEAALGGFDIKGLCRNPTLKGQNPTTGNDTRESVGCF